MTCRELRTMALRAGEGSSAMDDHARGCPACARFLARRALVATALGGERPAFEPDGSFATRVAARRGGDLELLGFAAFRMLPGAAAVALVALLLGITAPRSELELLFGPSEDALVLFLAGGAGR